MTDGERAAAIDAYTRDVLACTGIPADAASVSVFSAYVRCGDDGRCFVAGGLPVPVHSRGTYTCAPPRPDDPARTVPDFSGGGRPLPLPPERLALDLAAAGQIAAPPNFRYGAHCWSAPHNAS